MPSRLHGRPPRAAFLIAVAIATAFSVTAIAQTESTKPVMENDRIRVTATELSNSGKLPRNNKYDAMTVQLKEGDTAFLTPGKLAKSKATKSGDVHYFPAGSQHTIQSAGRRPLPFVEVQFLRAQGKYVAFDIPATHYCNPGAEKACVSEQYLFCTDRFCVETVTMEPGAISTQHTHDADHVVIATSLFRWRDEEPGQPGTSFDFKAGEVKYVRAGITHRLTNVGETTARMVVIQFK